METWGDQDPEDLQETSVQWETQDLQENQEDLCQGGLDPPGPLDSLVLQETKETQVRPPQTPLHQENEENQDRPATRDPKAARESQGSTVDLDLQDDQATQETQASAENQAPQGLKVFPVPAPVVLLLCEVLLETLDLRALMDPEEVLDRPDSEETEGLRESQAGQVHRAWRGFLDSKGSKVRRVGSRCRMFQVLKGPVESRGPLDAQASAGPQDRTGSPGPEETQDQRGTVCEVFVETQDPEAELEPGVFLELWAQPDPLSLGLWVTEGPLGRPVPLGPRDPPGPQDPKESFVPVFPRVQELQERRATLETQGGPVCLGPLGSEE